MSQEIPNLGQTNKNPVFIFILFAILLALFIFGYTFSENKYFKPDDISKPLGKVNEFKSPNITAKSAIVWDMRNKKIVYDKNSKLVLPIASLAKLMTVLAATELVPDYTIVSITRESLAEEGDSGLFLDEKWKLKDLISLTLISSSNDGSNAIASVAGVAAAGQLNENSMSNRDLFIKYLNTRTTELGLNSIKFLNENGLDLDSESSGAYGNAKDIAMLFDYIIRNHPNIIEPTRLSVFPVSSLDHKLHIGKNTNTITGEIPGLVASKTGFTDLAQGNLAVAIAPGMTGPYVIVVLSSTYEKRFADIELLVRSTLNYISPEENIVK